MRERVAWAEAHLADPGSAARQNRRMPFLPARRRAALAAVLLSLAACGGGGGSSDSTPAPAPPPPVGPGEQALNDSATYSTSAGAALPSATVEAAAITKHSIALNGTTLVYTATAGHLIARDPMSNAPEAAFFYIAYTADGADPATRPVTFFYNGGPGSATIWLHLGSFGPKRLATGDPSTAAPKPFPLVDNSETLLDTSDLVFVDAVGTGYSEAIAPRTNGSFWGVDSDAAVFRDFVARYVEANGRAASPKFLFGESYGTTRSAVLAHLLETAGVTLDGVVLQSSVLNYGTNCGVTGTPGLSCGGYFPSYGEIGAYFNLTTPPQPDADSYATTLRSFTEATYAPALALYLGSGTLPDMATLTQLQNLTGLAAARWQAHFNMPPDQVQANLLPGQLLGRYDARVTAPQGSSLAAGGDPSSSFISPEFASAIDSLLRNTLRYTNASPYVMLSAAIQSWDFHHDGAGLPDTIPDLAAAMAQNPQLQVLSLNGYHDLATPFFQTEQDLARLGANPNLQIKVYPGGHMTYLDDASRMREKSDLRAFYQHAVTLH
jgi:carboxypeptidase C (cathepsin A)